MFGLDLLTFALLIVSAVVIGIFAVVFGGTLFLSLPLFQILFPDMVLGALVGNLKFGSVLRNATALVPLRKELDPSVWPLGLALCAGSLIGAIGIANLTQMIVPIVLVVGILVSENAKRITIPEAGFWIGAFLVGVYGGILGAGIMLLVLALLQIHYMEITAARANALMLEMCLSAIAVVVFIGFDLLSWPIAITWAIGGMAGGYLGGHIVKHTGKLSPAWQQWLIRAAFAIAIVVAVWRLF